MRSTVVLILLCVLLLPEYSYGKGVEKGIFEVVCEQILAINKTDLLKKKLDGSVYVMSDPVGGASSLFYEDLTKAEVKEIVKTHTEEELIEILSSPDLHIDPVNGVYIIYDSAGIFSEQYTYKTSNTPFKVVKDTANRKNSCNTAMIGLINNKIVLFLSTPGSDDYIVFEFKFQNNGINFIRKSFVPKKLHGRIPVKVE